MKLLISFTLFMMANFGLYAQDYFLFTGTYTKGQSKGIYINKFNGKTGAITPVSITPGVENPSYLAISANGKFVYAVIENGGDKPGEVSSFSFDRTKGELTFLNKQKTSGDHPCYVAVDRNNKWLFTANYSGGSLAALPIQADGSIGPIAQLIQHTGKGTDPRQEKPHVHSTNFTPDQQYILAPDLGLDKVMIYKFTPSARQPLSQGADSFFSTKAGSGPRHLSFHPSKPWVYVIEELSGTVSAWTYKGSKYSPMQNISSHPAGYQGSKGSADIHTSPDGRFLYATNRGDANSIAVFAIDSKTGKLTLKGVQSTEGTHPRNFTIDPSGQFLLVANRDSNNIVVFSINRQTGLLTMIGKPYSGPEPVFLGFLK
jgi:6-phosphogluconolactonase